MLKLFVNACEQYGIPSRVRSDHGGENTKVALFLNLVRARSSHITGKSTHNQRIERLWLDVHTQATSKFYDEFYALEDAGNLDPDNDLHRFALQLCYLDVINERLEEFRQGWNNHKIRTEKHKTPHQLWLSGLIDNMGSDHTAPAEVFGRQVPVEESIELGLSRFGLTTEDLDVANEEYTSQPFSLDEDNLRILNSLLAPISEAKDKYIRCVAWLSARDSV